MMTKYEKLLSEYEDKLCVEERNMLFEGLYCDKNIWIKKGMTDAEKFSILAEEIGHYETSVGDILDQANLSNAKQEIKAMNWAFDKILSKEKIFEAITAGNTEIYDIAEYLGVSEAFLKGAMVHYGIKE